MKLVADKILEIYFNTETQLFTNVNHSNIQRNDTFQIFGYKNIHIFNRSMTADKITDGENLKRRMSPKRTVFMKNVKVAKNKTMNKVQLTIA